MKLELIPIGVTDIDRAKDFYTNKLGFKLDIDTPLGDKRFIQMTPPGSACSISFGVGVAETKPGAVDGLLLAVKDIESVYEDLSGKQLDITEPKMEPWGSKHCYFSDPDGNRWTIQQKKADL